MDMERKRDWERSRSSKMAAFRRGTLYVPPLVQCRHRGKINIQRPRPGPLERRVFDAITRPVLLETLEEPSKACSRIYRLQEADAEEHEVHPLERILLRECREEFERNKLLVLFFTYSMNGRTQQAIRNKLKNKGIRLKWMSNPLVRKTITDSRWENLLPLLHDRSLYALSEEPKIDVLVRELKKIPELVILGGILDNHILTREGLLHAAALPSKDILLGQTCSLLAAGAARTHSLLGSHQQALVSNLQQYVKDQTVGSTDQ